MDNDCSLVCMFCATQGTLYVNYACFHTVCNYHVKEIQVGTDLICKHCNSTVKILCLKQISIPICQYCEDNESSYQIPACRHWYCEGCLNIDMKSLQSQWFCNICNSLVENSAPFFIMQAEIKEKQKNASLVYQKPEFKAKINEKEKKDAAVPKKPSYQEEISGLPDIDCRQKKTNLTTKNNEEKKEVVPKDFGYKEKSSNLPDLSYNVQNKKLNESDLPDISYTMQNKKLEESDLPNIDTNYQHQPALNESLPDISSYLSNPSLDKQNLLPDISHFLQHQQAIEDEDIPDINPTESFIRREEDIVDSSVNVEYRSNKAENKQNLPWIQNDLSESEQKLDNSSEVFAINESNKLNPAKIDPKSHEKYYQDENPAAVHDEPAKMDELVMQCPICYSWYLDIMENGVYLYCEYCKLRFCPLCLTKLDAHQQCKIQKEISKSATFEDIYNINLRLKDVDLMVQKCPDCHWLQTYDKTEEDFNGYGTCRNEKCNGKKFCLWCSSGNQNPLHDCLSPEKLKKNTKYLEKRGTCFPKSFFEKRFHQ